MRPASQSLYHLTHPLDSEGDQYNVVLTVFTVGYIVGLIPNNLALQYFPYVPCLCVGCYLTFIYVQCASLAASHELHMGHTVSVRIEKCVLEPVCASRATLLERCWRASGA